MECLRFKSFGFSAWHWISTAYECVSRSSWENGIKVYFSIKWKWKSIYRFSIIHIFFLFLIPEGMYAHMEHRKKTYMCSHIYTHGVCSHYNPFSSSFPSPHDPRHMCAHVQHVFQAMWSSTGTQTLVVHVESAWHIDLCAKGSDLQYTFSINLVEDTTTQPSGGSSFFLTSFWEVAGLTQTYA